MDNFICAKVTSMLSAYIENKLNSDERLFIENHFAECAACRRKFYEMNEIIGSLHYEYEKMIEEFNKIEENKTFNFNEYEYFHENISPYIDDELCYEDSLKFRKYLLKSKPAREELSIAYGLRNNIRKSTANFMDRANINYSKKVIKKLKEDDKYLFPNIYKRAALVVCFMISILTALVIFISYSYLNKSYADNIPEKSVQNVVFPYDNDWVEFFFDEKGNCLLAAK